MSQLHLPEGYGSLGINFQLDNWRTESNLHSTDVYQQRLYELRRNSEDMYCYFCGFPDGPYLEIHNLDGDHSNFNRSNLRACCTLCHRLNHLGWVGVKAHGRLVQLPSNVHVEEELRIPISIEVFNLVQRFYLMSSYLSVEQQVKLESLPLKTSINTLLNAFKRRNYELNYHDIKRMSAKKAEEQAKIQDMNKEQKDQYFTEMLEQSKNAEATQEEEVSFLAGGLYIVDLVDALSKEHSSYLNSAKSQRPKISPSISFFKQQRSGKFGKLALWFNKEVFEPFAYDDFTLSERMDYYNNMNIFSPEGIAKILHSNREKNSKLPEPFNPAAGNTVNIDAMANIVDCENNE